ncbi:MAG TPA: hypothetical protein VGZ91_19620 [Candidatus Sulfotelmatobacter sp.]|nr:hypothetical protein [Candidatus Sulfotelmatobacter sp.]
MAVRIWIKADESWNRVGIVRMRETIRCATLSAALRMTGVVVSLLMCNAGMWATTYYVSSSVGSDTNAGTSSSAPWQTIAHVDGQTFLAGDTVLFKRGDVWNESLVPGSSGSSGNPIVFDAYGTGAAPNLTGYFAVPSTAWVLVTGNAWKAAVPATFTTVNFCLFGSVWGQKVAAVSSNLTAPGDFYLANGFLYVYSVGNPVTFYSEAIVPMALSNVPVINVNGRSWLTFQHFLVNWFDQYGVYVQGTSDHLVFANMESDSMIPQGTQPLGFYVDEGAPGPGDIKIYNAEGHLNYDAFRFDGAATAITMVNDKAYGNRDGALVDNTGGVTYSNCHFYASSLAVAGSTDVEWTSGTGPIAGAGNIAADTAPAVQVYQRYPAEVTLTVDDSGMTPGADTYYASTVLPVADAAGVPVGAAITVGYSLAQTLVSEFQGWINAGRDVTSHSMSHTYYTNLDALEVQYSGSGTAAVLNISGKVLTITVTGASDSVSYNLAQGQAEGTIKALRLALLATGKFTATEIPTCQGPYGTGCSAYTESALLAQDLADVSGQDVRSAVYHMQLDVTRLTTDEITLSRQWMTTNLTGLPATPVYVYPGGYETTTMQAITQGVPYMGARGALKEDLGVKDTYADGFNVQNITSFGVNPSWMGLPPASLNQKIQALVWKESVWGVPWGIFWHLNELTNSDPVGGTEITNLIQDFKASGATIQTNTGLVNLLLGGTQEIGADGNYYYTFPATKVFSSGGGIDFRPTKNSPVVDAGQNLGVAYALDINGVNQNSYGSGWEIGAHVYQGYAVYGEGTGGGGRFTIGGNPFGGPPNYARSSTSTANPGTIAPIFASGIPAGTLNVSTTATGGCTPTGTQACGTWVAGNQWSTSYAPSPSGDTSINIAGSSYGVVAWDSATVLTLRTTPAVTNPATFSIPAECVGNCQNSTAYDTTLNATGIDCITRITDGSSFPNGLSMGDLTASGGDNDIMGSVNETYLGVDTGQVYILHMNTSGNCIQVENTGISTMHVAGPFGFSKVIDTRFYYLVNNTQLWEGDISGVVPSETFASTELYDLTGTTGPSSNPCPGVNWATFGTPSSASIMGISQTDGRFGWSVGPGGQGTADWGFVWDRTLGCASVNNATGQYWAFCSGTNCGPSTPASGTLASTGCYGSNGAAVKGIHDSQMSGDGNYMLFTIQNPPWSGGACAGSTIVNQQTEWQIGTAGSQWTYGTNSIGVGGANLGSHNSVGVTNIAAPFNNGPTNNNGPNLRPIASVASFTGFEATGLAPTNVILATDEHCAWPHPLNDDSFPWVCASDLTTIGNGGVYSPTYMQNVVYAWFPNAAYPLGQAPTLFTHTFSCGASSDAVCTRGADASFGSQQSIGAATQKGNYFCWSSTHLHNLGNDNLGNARADGFCVHLQ